MVRIGSFYLKKNEATEEVDEIDEKQLKTLQESISGLSKKAIRKLKKLLDSDNTRVQMQTALGVLRATVQALTRDTSPRALAQKFTSIQRLRSQLSRATLRPSQPAQAPGEKPGDGTPSPLVNI